MITTITIRIVHDNPKVIEYVKTLISMVIVKELNIQFASDISIEHNNK